MNVYMLCLFLENFYLHNSWTKCDKQVINSHELLEEIVKFKSVTVMYKKTVTNWTKAQAYW